MSSKTPALSRLFELQKLLLTFHAIERVVHVPGADKLETDTEHSYSLAMMAWFLSAYFPELNRDECIRFALAHDLVEVYAGDTFVYADAKTLATKPAREHAALVRLTEEWPDFPDLIEAIQLYEQRESPEACFIYALDKIMPPLMIFMAEGRTWQEKNITIEMLYDSKINKVRLSPPVKKYFDELIELIKKHPHYFEKQS